MAASILQKTLFSRGTLFLNNRLDAAASCSIGQVRSIKFKNRNRRPKPLPCLNDMAKSLAHKGYLRPQDPYTPPENVAGKVHELLNTAPVSDVKSLKRDDKLAFFTLCATEFGRSVPNSLLHQVNSIDDVIEFYQTPVDTFLPLDDLKTRELPPNLHIQHEYLRFNPSTDTKFNGQTAFPKSSTIVTGLKYRKKYAGFEAKRSWP